MIFEKYRSTLFHIIGYNTTTIEVIRFLINLLLLDNYCVVIWFIGGCIEHCVIIV